MLACTQPGCTGTIVDGYCDVCGSPAAAVPFVLAEAAVSGSSPVPAAGPGLTAVGRGAGFPPEPKTEGLNTACTQPECTGSIVDGYCDVCGSPAVVVPFVPAEAAASASTQERADPGAADPGAVAARKVDGEKVDPAADDTGENYRTRVEEAQLPDYVHEAALREVGKLERTSDQSPESGEIRIWLDTILDLPWSTETTDWIDIQGSREVEATLRKLIEPAVAADLEGGDSGEIEGVAADLEAGDSGEIERLAAALEEGDTAEGEPSVADLEAGGTAEIERVAAALGEGDTAEGEPAVADLEEDDTAEIEGVAAALEEGDTAEGEPAVADLDKADTAPAGPAHDHTVTMPPVPSVLSGSRPQRPQLPEQPVLGNEPVQTPAKKRRFGYLAVAAAALAALLIGALLAAANRDRGVTAQSVPTATASATPTVTKPTNEPSNESTAIGREEPTVQLKDLPDPARPFETVQIQGTYPGEGDTFLRVQRWENGKWLDFPLPTKTDKSGRFTAYVELGQPGRYRLRVLDPDSGVACEPFVLVIKA